MKRKTCMCGYSTDKESQWDDSLDQCKTCSKESNRVQKIQAYLDTFRDGDLVYWRDTIHLIVRRSDDGMWRLLDPSTGKPHNFFARNWVMYSDCPNIREIIYKRTDSDRPD